MNCELNVSHHESFELHSSTFAHEPGSWIPLSVVQSMKFHVDFNTRWLFWGRRRWDSNHQPLRSKSIAVSLAISTAQFVLPLSNKNNDKVVKCIRQECMLAARCDYMVIEFVV